MTLEKYPDDPLSRREGCGDMARHDPMSSEIVVRILVNDTILSSFPTKDGSLVWRVHYK